MPASSFGRFKLIAFSTPDFIFSSETVSPCFGSPIKAVDVVVILFRSSSKTPASTNGGAMGVSNGFVTSTKLD